MPLSNAQIHEKHNETQNPKNNETERTATPSAGITLYPHSAFQALVLRWIVESRFVVELPMASSIILNKNTHVVRAISIFG
jgi:hypothetical protein